MGVAFVFLAADGLVVALCCLPYGRGSRVVAGLLAAVIVAVAGLAVLAGREGALVVLVYLGPALVAAAARLGYELVVRR